MTAQQAPTAPQAARIVEAVEKRFGHLVTFLQALVRGPLLRGREDGAQALVASALRGAAT